jgi:hypothetical protein
LGERHIVNPPLGSNEMARPVYLKKKVYIFILDYRDIANRVTSNECRLLCIPDTWLKIAQEHSARVGLSEYVYQNTQNMFQTNFPKKLSTKK